MPIASDVSKGRSNVATHVSYPLQPLNAHGGMAGLIAASMCTYLPMDGHVTKHLLELH